MPTKEWVLFIHFVLIRNTSIRFSFNSVKFNICALSTERRNTSSTIATANFMLVASAVHRAHTSNSVSVLTRLLVAYDTAFDEDTYDFFSSADLLTLLALNVKRKKIEPDWFLSSHWNCSRRNYFVSFIVRKLCWDSKNLVFAVKFMCFRICSCESCAIYLELEQVSVIVSKSKSRVRSAFPVEQMEFIVR